MTGYSTQAAIRHTLERQARGFQAFSISDQDTLPKMFQRVASAHPDKIAIASGEAALTYAQLESMSKQIGAVIASQSTETRRNPIAVMISAHTLFAAAALGVLRAGSFYVPIDPEFPEHRVSQMLEIAGIKAVLTQRAHQDLVTRLLPPGMQALYVDDLPKVGELDHDVSVATDLACIIFTSGSTGQPKGVMQTHANILQVVRRYTDSLCIVPHDRVSLLSSCSVTASIAPMFSSLLNGCCLCAFSVRRSGLLALADWLDASRITLYHSVPSLFRQLMRSIPAGRTFNHLRVVRMGGDSVRSEDWQLFAEHCPDECVFVNSYGCSEMSTVACFYLDKSYVPSAALVPVGYPLHEVEICIRSEDGVETPVTPAWKEQGKVIAGEIVLKSRYLSTGYWKNETATAAGFSTSPADAEVRIYRTGDVAELRPGCGLMHFGRADAQVKISGFRVETAEVEAHLRKFPGVTDAAVLVATAEHGERALIGFVEAPAASIVGQEARSYIHQHLPAHMVPSEVVSIASFPRTPNGKLDRKALMALRDSVRITRSRTAAATPTELALSEIWREILNREQLGVDEDFFELGGNSLLGMKIVARVEEIFGVKLPALAVFEYPTAKQMATIIDAKRPRMEAEGALL